MKNKFLKISSLFFLVGGLLIVKIATAKASLADAFRAPLNTMADKMGFDTSRGDINDYISLILNVVLSFLGVVFLILMVYGGFIWMTAQGDEKQVEQARNLIVAGIIGLLIIFVAYAVTSFMGVLR